MIASIYLNKWRIINLEKYDTTLILSLKKKVVLLLLSHLCPDASLMGGDLKEAKEMAIDAIRAYITSLKKHNEPIPSDEDSLVGTIELSFPQRTYTNA